MDYCLWVVCWVRRKGTQWPTPPWSLGHRELVTCRTGSDFLWYQTLTKPNTDTQWEEGSHCSHTHAKTWLGEFCSCLVWVGWGGSVWSQILTSNYALEKSLNKNSLPPVFFCLFVCLFFGFLVLLAEISGKSSWHQSFQHFTCNKATLMFDDYKNCHRWE